MLLTRNSIIPSDGAPGLLSANNSRWAVPVLPHRNLIAGQWQQPGQPNVVETLI